MANVQKWEVKQAAGFYEGEGSCIIHRKNALQVAAYQSGNPWPLHQLRRLFGGRVHTYLSRGTAKNGLPYKPHGQWTIYGPQAALFLQAVMPHLSPLKQRRVGSCLKQWQQTKNGNGK